MNIPLNSSAFNSRGISYNRSVCFVYVFFVDFIFDSIFLNDTEKLSN